MINEQCSSSLHAFSIIRIKNIGKKKCVHGKHNTMPKQKADE
jgi:hypothetical protein